MSSFSRFATKWFSTGDPKIDSRKVSWWLAIVIVVIALVLLVVFRDVKRFDVGGLFGP